MKKISLIILIIALCTILLLMKDYILEPINNIFILRRVDISINKAIDFLYKNQLEYGEFKTYLCLDKNMKDCNFDSSPFTTTFVLYALNDLKNEKAKHITEKAINFLLEEQEKGGIWRYWSSRNTKKIAPDLDDISTISFILKINNINFDNNYKLIRNNINENGLFFTWISPEHENDIDCVVNANILMYLGENNPFVCSYINEAIKLNKSCSIYYSSRLSLLYMVSRAFENDITCFGENRDIIINYILDCQNQDGSFGNEIETALALNALLNFDYFWKEVEQGIVDLLEKQLEDGSWERNPTFCRGMNLSDLGPYFGSEELTTALALEALRKYSSIK